MGGTRPDHRADLSQVSVSELPHVLRGGVLVGLDIHREREPAAVFRRLYR